MQKYGSQKKKKHQKEEVLNTDFTYSGPASDNSCNQIPRGIADHR